MAAGGAPRDAPPRVVRGWSARGHRAHCWGVAHWVGRSPFWPAPVSGTLNSLCRVLFTVRSLYLFAIGLVPVFEPCEGWTSPFELHFQAALLAGGTGLFACPARRSAAQLGAVTLCRTPFQTTCRKAREGLPPRSLQSASGRALPRPPTPRISAGGSRPRVSADVASLGDGSRGAPLHSPLLGQSPLLLVPPPTDMLKLGRSLCAPSG